MIKRSLTPELIAAARQYPVVTITGPRQSGKTTLVKHAFPEKPYINLEELDTRELANEDPRRFLAQFPHGAIFDEVQRTPGLLSYIQVIVDDKKINGFFILTGSHQLSLHQAITQSLAGRTALLNLYPLSLHELEQADLQTDTDELLLKGGFPRIYEQSLDPTKASRSYLQTYIERDVRQLINIKDLGIFSKFLKLCAGRIGSLLEITSLANDVGVSTHTVREWLSVLEASFIIFRLHPYHENFSKRIIKTSKLYFTDLGLASYLLGLENTMQISRDPLRGFLFENLVILELLKYRANQGLDPNLYFYRDSQQNELDIIIQSGHELIPVEIKSAQTFNKHALKNLRYFQTLVGQRMPCGFLIYDGEKEQDIHSLSLLNYRHTHKIWEKIINDNVSL